MAMERGVAVSPDAIERVVTAEEVAQAEALLSALAERGSPTLRAELEPVVAQIEGFAGRTPEIWEMLKEGERRLYLPLVLSNVEGPILNNAGGAERQGSRAVPISPDLSRNLPLDAPQLAGGRKAHEKWFDWVPNEKPTEPDDYVIVVEVVGQRPPRPTSSL